MVKKEERDSFDFLDNISEHVTLVQLMDSLGNVNNSVSVLGKWIFDSNYKKSLPLTIESLNLLCYCSEKWKIFTLFDTVFYSVIYM